tara:strand:+ start:381 stop:605 length:225 start_codon:yes stop_codon:yes gene_type:complete
MFFCSCVPKQEYDRVLKVNKDIKSIMQTNEILTQELKQLNFKVKNIEFSLQMCEIKLRKQNKNLVKCINLRGCK